MPYRSPIRVGIGESEAIQHLLYHSTTVLSTARIAMSQASTEKWQVLAGFGNSWKQQLAISYQRAVGEVAVIEG
jgi:hypothetical protein